MTKAQEKALRNIHRARHSAMADKTLKDADSMKAVDRTAVQFMDFFSRFYAKKVDAASALNMEIAFLTGYLDGPLFLGTVKIIKRLIKQAEAGIAEYRLFRENPREFARRHDLAGGDREEIVRNAMPLTRTRSAFRALRKSIGMMTPNRIFESDHYLGQLARFKEFYAVERGHVLEYLDCRDYPDENEKAGIVEKLMAKFDVKMDHDIQEMTPISREEWLKTQCEEKPGKRGRNA